MTVVCAAKCRAEGFSDLRNSSVKNGLRALQFVGGLSQIAVGGMALSNPFTFVPGLIAIGHGLSNLAQSTTYTNDNVAQEIYKQVSLNYTGSETAGNVAFFGVDISIAGTAALTKVLTPLAKASSNVSTINHSSNLRNALGGNNIFFKGDKIREVQTRAGASLLINDAVLIGRGINDE